MEERRFVAVCSWKRQFSFAKRTFFFALLFKAIAFSRDHGHVDRGNGPSLLATAKSKCCCSREGWVLLKIPRGDIDRVQGEVK